MSPSQRVGNWAAFVTGTPVGSGNGKGLSLHVSDKEVQKCVMRQEPRSGLSTTRRQLLQGAVAAILGATTMMRGERRRWDANAAEALGAEATKAELQSRVSDTVALPSFVEGIEKKKTVTRVWFFGNTNQSCYFLSTDGKVHAIGEGFPEEASRSPESPLHIMARLRELRIPYSTNVLPSSFLRRS